jgi:hypothetical protein
MKTLLSLSRTKQFSTTWTWRWWCIGWIGTVRVMRPKLGPRCRATGQFAQLSPNGKYAAFSNAPPERCLNFRRKLSELRNVMATCGTVLAPFWQRVFVVCQNRHYLRSCVRFTTHWIMHPICRLEVTNAVTRGVAQQRMAGVEVVAVAAKTFSQPADQRRADSRHSNRSATLGHQATHPSLPAGITLH